MKLVKQRCALGPRAAVLCLGIMGLLGLPASVGAQNRNIRFDHLAVEHGLSQSFVNCIFQDSQGFMWFGTEDGLNRYDGQKFKVFKHDPSDPNSLSHSFVWAIEEDASGAVWIGTKDGGLSVWSGHGERFRHFKNDPANPTSLSHDRVRDIHKDRNGVLWIGTDGGGLNRYNAATESFERFNHNPSNPNSLSSDRIRVVYEDSDGVLWIGTFGGGVNRLDAATSSFAQLGRESGDPILRDAEVNVIYESRDGSLWAGTEESGLLRIERDGESFVRYVHDSANPASLGAGAVRAIYEDSEGTLWIGTDAVLNEWQPLTDTFVHYEHVPGDPKSLGPGTVSGIYQDRGDVLWIATKTGGLSKWNLKLGTFPHFEKNPANPESLSSNVVSSFFEESEGVVWVGTFGGGLNRFNRATGAFKHYEHDPDDPRSLGDNRVMSLLIDRRGVLWVGTFAGGLNRFNRATGTFTRFQNDPKDPYSLSRDAVMSLYEDREGVLWIGTFEGGLNRLDRATGIFTHYMHDPLNPTSLGSNIVTSFWEDSSGILWVGTDGGGLSRFDRATGTFASHRNDPNDSNSLGSDSVMCLHGDRDGVLWIGTQGGGLHAWDQSDREAHRGVFRRYTEREGLANDTIFGILSDDEGNLWLSTNKGGLSKLSTRGQTFKSYDTTNGLQGNEFNFGAYHRGASGRMYFGGINGFNAFLPEGLQDNAHEPPVVLTTFLKFNEEVELEQPLSRTEEIELTYRDYVISFEFAALDFTAPQQNRYAYKLEGFDQGWIGLGTLNRATFTNLDPGRYVLRVRGSNNDGVWNEEGVSLKLRAIPPPWQTWWAYSIYSLVLVGVVFAYIRAQARKLEREAEYSRKLEHQVHERTAELAESNEELQAANQKLEEATLTDSLTGLRNRRYLMTHIQGDLALVERAYRKMGNSPERRASEAADFLFIMIDLDGLKQVNDVYGHAAGDLALLQMREILQKACRQSDTLIRWGGDEFMVVGRGVDRVAAETVVERIRASVEEHPFDLGLDKSIRLSASIGFAFYPFVPDVPTLLNGEQIVTIADRALYVAKKSGRNAWVGIQSTEATPHDDLVRSVTESLELMTLEGKVELTSSIEEPARLVWSHA